MNSASLELFKRALAEGTDIRFRKAAEADADATACSARHLEIMERIMSGTYRKPISLSSARIKIAAAIVAAMFLLSGCVMIYKDEIRGFIDACEGKAPCRATAEDGVALMKIIDAIYESAKTGHSVEIHNL